MRNYIITTLSFCPIAVCFLTYCFHPIEFAWESNSKCNLILSVLAKNILLFRHCEELQKTACKDANDEA